ncbi:hypothetical protein Droror1_Dr00011495 [Drosera rotundifolia]
METVPNPESVAKEADGACKKEEKAPVIETAYQKRLEEEKVRHEHEQQMEVELFGQSHDHDIQEKHGLSSMLEHKWHAGIIHLGISSSECTSAEAEEYLSKK